MKTIYIVIGQLGRFVRKIKGRKSRPMFPEPNFFESLVFRKESQYRKKATAFKKAKKYMQAVEYLRLAREMQYLTIFYYDCETLLRVPKYLILAGKYQQAINEANYILKGRWPMSGDKEEFRNFNRERIFGVISDAFKKSGNVRMATYYGDMAKRELMSVCAARVEAIKREFEKTWKETGSDLGIISADCGFSDLPCSKWHGKKISVLGKTAGYPTLQDVDQEALFGYETYHRVDFYDPVFD